MSTTSLWTQDEEEKAAGMLLGPLIRAGLSEPEQRAVLALRLNNTVKAFTDGPCDDDIHWRSVLKLLAAFRSVGKLEPERGGPGDL